MVELLLRYARTQPASVAERIRLQVKRLNPPWGAPGVPELSSWSMKKFNQGWGIGRKRLPFYTLGGLIDYAALEELVQKAGEWMPHAVPGFVWDQYQDGTVAYSSTYAVPGTPGLAILPQLGPDGFKYFHTNLDNSVDSRRRVLDAAMKSGNAHWEGTPLPDFVQIRQLQQVDNERTSSIVTAVRDTLGPSQMRTWPFRLDELRDHAVVLTGALDSLSWFIVSPAGDTIRTNSNMAGVGVYADTVLTQLMTLVEFTAPDTGQYILGVVASQFSLGGAVDFSGIVLGDGLVRTLVSGVGQEWNPSQIPVVTVTGPEPVSGMEDTVWVRMSREDGLGRVFVLHDDGVGPDQSAGDGVFAGQCPNPQSPGFYSGQAEWTRHKEGIVVATRRAFVSMTVNTSTVEVGGNGSPVTVDTDNDGSIDSLRVPITLASDDTTAATAALWSSDSYGNVISSATDVDLNGGTSYAEVAFLGYDLFTSGVQGTVSLDSCAVWRRDHDSSALPASWSSISWGPFNVEDYQHPSADSLHVLSEVTVDGDSDGQIDALRITYGFRVNDYGTYAPHFTLESDTGLVVEVCESTQSFSPGSRTVVAQFSGLCLGHAPTRSWQIRQASVTAPDGEIIRAEDYTTNDYSASVFEGETDVPSAAISDTLINACPQGDRDKLLITVGVPRQCPSEDVNRYDCVAIIRSDSDPRIKLWRPTDEAGNTIVNGKGYESAGDTLLSQTFDPGSGTLTFQRKAISGCGRIFIDVKWRGAAVGATLTALVRGSDIDQYAIGFCDSHDSLLAVAGDICADDDFDGDTDYYDWTGHLRHHLLWRGDSPEEGEIRSQMDTLAIRWNRAYGDSARVSLHLLRSGTSFDRLIIEDVIDTGTYKWLIPYAVPVDSQYYVQIIHRVMARGQRMAYGSGNTKLFKIAPAVVLPNAVNDLNFAAGRNTGVIWWSEPGQVDVNADEYDVRIKSATITEQNFYTATSVGSVGSPGPEGTAHCFDLSLGQCSTYYVAMKTRVGSAWSQISNVAHASTACSGNFMASCEGLEFLTGGGGNEELFLKRRQEETLAVAGQPLGSSGGENSILNVSSEPVSDLLRIGEPAVVNGKYFVAFRNAGDRTIEIDHVGIGFVDHGIESEAISTGNGVAVGVKRIIGGIMDASGIALTLDGDDGTEPFSAQRGDWLAVHMTPGGDSKAVVITCRSPKAGSLIDSSGVWVQRWDGEEWAVESVIHPRVNWDTFAVPVGEDPVVRLLFLGPYSVKGIKQLDLREMPAPTPLAIVSAVQSREGDVSALLANENDADAAVLLPGDSLTVMCSLASVSGLGVREFFLRAKGMYLRPEIAANVARAKRQDRNSYTFALGRARPNPSAKEVTIDYTVARSVPVTIRVYDVAGRLVRTLVNEQLEPGPHTIVWDGRDEDSRRVSSGVFYYRMVAGTFSSQRKSVLVTR